MKIISLVFMLFLTAPAGAQPAEAPIGAVTSVQAPAKPVLKRKAVRVPKEDTAIAPAKDQTGKKESAKGEQYEEEGAVMIDARSDEDYSGRLSDNEPAAAAEGQDPVIPGGMPASYGQLKGTLNESGRSLLVFENDGGILSFVQILAGKNVVSWKLISRIYRSAD